MIHFNSKDLTEYVKDVQLEKLTDKQKDKIKCWHFTLHNPIVDTLGYTLLLLFSIFVPLKLDKLFNGDWFLVFLPLFISLLLLTVRCVSVIPDRMAMVKHGAYKYNPRLTRNGGFVYCFAHHHRKNYKARVHATILSLVLFSFFFMTWVKVSNWNFARYLTKWIYVSFPLLLFFAGLIQAAICGFGTPKCKKSGSWILLLFLVPIEILIIFFCLKLDGFINWSWWSVTSPSWIVMFLIALIFLITWMNVLRDSIFQKRKGACNVIYSGIVMIVFAILIFGPIILFQTMMIYKFQYSWPIPYWLISIPLFIQEIFILPLSYLLWRRYY